MRKFILVFLTVMSAALSYGQSGFQEGRYYNQQYSISEQCGGVYPVLQGYNYYGTPIYFGYQDCRRVQWHSYYGSYTGYFWTVDPMGNYTWQTRTEYRTWWYYTWVTYTRRVY